MQESLMLGRSDQKQLATCSGIPFQITDRQKRKSKEKTVFRSEKTGRKRY
jgi:hypothetical protein